MQIATVKIATTTRVRVSRGKRSQRAMRARVSLRRGDRRRNELRRRTTQPPVTAEH